MPIWAQNLVIAMLLLAAGGYVAWQMIGTLLGRKSNVGSCCSRGCGESAPAKKPAERVVFLPVEMLGRKK